jgi:hypothetical protein
MAMARINLDAAAVGSKTATTFPHLRRHHPSCKRRSRSRTRGKRHHTEEEDEVVAAPPGSCCSHQGNTDSGGEEDRPFEDHDATESSLSCRVRFLLDYDVPTSSPKSLS